MDNKYTCVSVRCQLSGCFSGGSWFTYVEVEVRASTCMIALCGTYCMQLSMYCVHLESEYPCDLKSTLYTCRQIISCKLKYRLADCFGVSTKKKLVMCSFCRSAYTGNCLAATLLRRLQEINSVLLVLLRLTPVLSLSLLTNEPEGKCRSQIVSIL